MAKVCVDCGAPIQAEWNICAECGAPVLIKKKIHAKFRKEKKSDLLRLVSLLQCLLEL